MSNPFLQAIENAIGEITPQHTPDSMDWIGRGFSPYEIIRAAEESIIDIFGFTPRTTERRKTSANTSNARAVWLYIARHKTDCSWEQLGELCDVHGTTVRYHLKRDNPSKIVLQRVLTRMAVKLDQQMAEEGIIDIAAEKAMHRREAEANHFRRKAREKWITQ